MTGHIRNIIFSVFSVFMVLTVLVGISAGSASAAEPAVHTIQGEVVAVSVNETPQILVLKTMTPNKKEMIVGATVESGAPVMRGKNRATLGDIKVGETVQLKYVKGAEGLVAKSVHAR